MGLVCCGQSPPGGLFLLSQPLDSQQVRARTLVTLDCGHETRGLGRCSGIRQQPRPCLDSSEEPWGGWSPHSGPTLTPWEFFSVTFLTMDQSRSLVITWMFMSLMFK